MDLCIGCTTLRPSCLSPRLDDGQEPPGDHKKIMMELVLNIILNKPRRRKLKMEGRVMYLANSDMPWKWYQWDIVQV